MPLCSPNAGLLTLQTLAVCSTEGSYGSCTWQENSLLLKLFWGQEKVMEAPKFLLIEVNNQRFRAKWVRWCVSAQLRWLRWLQRDVRPPRTWHVGLGGRGIFEERFKISHRLRQSCVLWSKGSGARAKLVSCCCCAGRRNWRRKEKAEGQSHEVTARVIGCVATNETAVADQLELAQISDSAELLVDHLGKSRSSALSAWIWITVAGSLLSLWKPVKDTKLWSSIQRQPTYPGRNLYEAVWGDAIVFWTVIVIVFLACNFSLSF